MPSQTFLLKGLGSEEQEGIITPLQGNFNTLFCVLIVPPSDPLLMNTLGPYHSQFVFWLRGGAGGGGGVCLLSDDNSVKSERTTTFV